MAVAHRQQQDIDRLMPGTEIRTIFDVGAYTGGTVTGYRDAFPDAEIWAFEPVPATYEQLVQETQRLDRIRAINLAMGARPGIAYIPTKVSDKAMLVSDERPGTVPVQVVTGDAFCDEHGVDRIGLLKIDTEGTDLDVLVGFHCMLGTRRVDLVYVEAGTHARNLRHVPLERFKGYLEPMGFAICRMYSMAHERPGPHLRRVDALFVSPQLIERHS
jgi:FkbM family methyltransferase